MQPNLVTLYDIQPGNGMCSRSLTPAANTGQRKNNRNFVYCASTNRICKINNKNSHVMNNKVEETSSFNLTDTARQQQWHRLTFMTATHQQHDCNTTPTHTVCGGLNYSLSSTQLRYFWSTGVRGLTAHSSSCHLHLRHP